MKTVRYGRLVNLGNYENERIEVEEIIGEGETREEALDRARCFVLEQSDRLKQERTAVQEIDRLEYRKQRLIDEIESLKTQREEVGKVIIQMRDFLRINAGVRVDTWGNASLVPLETNEAEPATVAANDDDDDDDIDL